MVGPEQPSINTPDTLEARLGALQTIKGTLYQSSFKTSATLEAPSCREVEELIDVKTQQTLHIWRAW